MFIDCIDITGPAITIDNTNNCLERIKEIFPAGAVPNVGMVAGWFVMPLQSVYNYTGLGTTLNILELEDASGNEILRVQMLPNQLRVRWGPTTGGQLKSVNLNNNSGVQINRSALQYQSDGTTPISAQANRIKILWAVSFSGTQMNVMYAYEDAAGNLVSAEGGYANTTYVGNTAVTNLHLFVHTLNALAGAHGFITVRNHETTLAEIQGIYRNIGQVAGAGDPARLMWHTGGNWTGRTGCVWQMHGGLSGEMGSSNITDTEVRYKAREGFAVRDDNMNFYAVLASGGTPNPAGDMDAGHLDAVTVMDTGNELTWKWNETLGFNLEEDPETLAILNFATYPYQAGFRATSRSQAAFEFFNQSATRQWRLWAHGNSRVGGTADDLSEQWISNNLTAFEYGVAATRGYWQGMTLYLQETNPHLIVGGITSANPERGNTGLVFYTGYHSGSLGFNRNDYDVVWPTNTSVHRVDMCRAALVTAKSGTRVGGGDITWIKPGGYAVLMQPNLEPIQGDDPIDIFVGVLRYPHAPDALNVRRVWSMAEVTGGPPAGTTATPAHDEEDASPTEMTGFNSVPPLTGSVKVHSYNAGALELDLPDDAIAGSIPAAGRIVTISDGTNMHFGMITSFTGLPDNTATLEFTFGVAPTIVADTSHDAF